MGLATINPHSQKESKKSRRKQPGKLMAKSPSQPVNLPGSWPLMSPLLNRIQAVFMRQNKRSSQEGGMACSHLYGLHRYLWPQQLWFSSSFGHR